MLETATKQEIKKGPVYRFDIFKGIADQSGKVHKMKSVGSATLLEGCKTYTIYLKTFLNDVFYMLPEQKKMTDADYVILTREPSHTPGRKYFWNSIGEGSLLSGDNSGYMQLNWDMFGAHDIYMNLCPVNRDANQE